MLGTSTEAEKESALEGHEEREAERNALASDANGAEALGPNTKEQEKKALIGKNLRDTERNLNELSLRPILGNEFERATSLASSLAVATDAKGSYYPSHSRGVEQIARSVAEHMGCFTPSHIARIALAGLLHDVGKLLTPDRILLKPGPFDPEEESIMRDHPGHGEKIMLAAGYGDESYWVRHHHSRWDGEGYPDGIKREAIPIESRIIGVADAFHAMQSDRPYHRAQTVGWALAELAKNSGTQFYPAAVEALLTMSKTR